MSHIVIHEDNDNITQYRQFDDVADAATYLEELHNVEGLAGARLFALDEVQFAVTSYVKVEIGASAPTTFPASDDSVREADGSSDPAFHDSELPGGEMSDNEVTKPVETVEYVEAAMAPVDAFAPVSAPSGSESADEPVGGGEVRRGLFGR
jgi:hypothetical protein